MDCAKWVGNKQPKTTVTDMKFQQIIPYKIKTLLPALGIAGAGLVTSCDPEITWAPAPSEITIQFDINNTQTVYDMNSDGTIRPSDILDYYMSHPGTETIYLHATGSWRRMMYNNITSLRHLQLEPIINMSPKIRGHGNFDFRPGEASKIPADSLWFIQNGWTINQEKQH